MAYLYEYSATWRAIVAASRNRKVLLAVTAVTTGGFYLMGRGTLQLTSTTTESTEEAMRNKMETNPEMKRYSQNGEAALAALFESVGHGGEQNDKFLNRDIQLPAVGWHPGVERRAARRVAQNASRDASIDTQAKQ